VYICLCNALTDRRLQQAVRETDGATPNQIYAACGCRAQCGKCVKAVLDMLRDNAERADAMLQGAD
jgi:bacterioferritin-associated ferredoxin